MIDPTAGRNHIYTVVAEHTDARLHCPILSESLLIRGVDRLFDTGGQFKGKRPLAPLLRLRQERCYGQ